MKKRLVLLVLLLITSLFLISCGSGSASSKKNAVKYAPDAIKEIFDEEGTDDIEILKIYWVTVDLKATMYDEIQEGLDITYYISYKVNNETKYIKIDFANFSGTDSFSYQFYSSETNLKDDFDDNVVSIKPGKKLSEAFGVKYKRFVYGHGSFSKDEINNALDKAKE